MAVWETGCFISSPLSGVQHNEVQGAIEEFQCSFLKINFSVEEVAHGLYLKSYIKAGCLVLKRMYL